MNQTQAEAGLFLGLDSSTQGLKATLIGRDLKVVFEDAVNFDRDLPEFKTEGGVHRHADGLTVTSPPLMWVAAVDLLFAGLREAGCPLERIAAVSGSGQQHGSVWLKKEAREALANLDAARPLRDQLADVFTVEDSPIWMDASTLAECRALEQSLGGAQAVADLTGSRAYPRFTGNQIAKIFAHNPAAYEQTDCIGLVSSFVASLLAGHCVPIDTGDGSGMNLMDIRGRQWAPAALESTAPGLKQKLGPLVPGHTIAGRIHAYYVEKYGFPPSCEIVAFSGDNPNSLAGLRLQRAGDVAISLGTSDTMFGYLTDPKPSGVEGHIFANPVDPGAYMVMLVHQNGSLARERVRDAAAGGSWKTFAQHLQRTPPGNQGQLAFYIFEPEISPPILSTGTFRFDAGGTAVEALPPEAEARAVLESQFLSLRLHGSGIGLRPATILATGGASANEHILKVLSDVFGVPVFVGEQTASASLGAAYRALHGWRCQRQGRFVPFGDVLAGAPPFRKAVDPDMDAHALYSQLLPRFESIEKKVASGQA